MKKWLVVPAAGLGNRFGSILPKQYSVLRGRTIIEHSLERLLSIPCEALIVAIHSQDSIWPTLPISSHEHIRVVVGGDERADSVFNALKAIEAEADDQDWVLVHDVVRPCITMMDLQTLISACADSSVGGLLATPVNATLKRVVSSTGVAAGVVDETVDREGLWLAATPQIFRYGLLVAALKHCFDNSLASTDEAAAMELAGHHPIIVQGRSDNIKLTYAEDLMLAEAILQAQAASAPDVTGSQDGPQTFGQHSSEQKQERS